MDRLLTAPDVKATTAESHMLLAAALDALGFKRLGTEKTRRLSELISLRKERPLSPDEVAELSTLMREADVLELESLQRLAATLKR